MASITHSLLSSNDIIGMGKGSLNGIWFPSTVLNAFLLSIGWYKSSEALMSAWSCENASFQLRSSSYRVLNFSSTFFDPHVICLLLLALYENKICMQEFLYNFIRALSFREGFKKKSDFITLGSDPP